MSRRLKWVVVAACLSGASIGAQAQTIRTDGGEVRGAVEADVESWKGIPFAAPPVGPLRWRAPQPAAKWTGTFDATAYGHDCMQKPFGGDAAPLGTAPSEDCLVLNVWRPAGTGAAAGLPVIVWIYGGGFVNGGSSPPTYAGAALARQGVVLVSFNYRVGRFGTFAHPQLSREKTADGLLGNYGYLDQLAALQWVKRNIASFGGNPRNVTIMGESAGGMSVHALITSPMGKGLFQRAIIMSGGDGTAHDPVTLAQAEKTGADFLQSKGIAPDDPEALQKMRALPAGQVVDGLNLMALFAKGPRTFSSPFPDGRIAVDTGAAYASGRFAHVPVMIGATSNDIGGRDGFMVSGARRSAAVLADTKLPVFSYRFSYVAESIGGSGGGSGAGHATDIPFFFDTTALKYGAATTARDRTMARTISRYVVNFARMGDPNGAGLPDWPRYDPHADRIMDFTSDGQAVPGKDAWTDAAETHIRTNER
ncbi:MAG TPA: carboxylesterase family protein [Sphingobium sp.]|uniref:carboxylesterase/lipase family protein n=1 Tax=Sphingobium sp. TaxID=1912891 RepID=UPI002ED4306C